MSRAQKNTKKKRRSCRLHFLRFWIRCCRSSETAHSWTWCLRTPRHLYLIRHCISTQRRDIPLLFLLFYSTGTLHCAWYHPRCIPSISLWYHQQRSIAATEALQRRTEAAEALKERHSDSTACIFSDKWRAISTTTHWLPQAPWMKLMISMYFWKARKVRHLVLCLPGWKCHTHT